MKKSYDVLLDPETILPARNNSRREDEPFSEAEEPDDEQSFAQFCRAIGKHGLLNPIVVRRVEVDEAERFELVRGTRRLRAWKIARPGERVPARVRELSDYEALAEDLVDNVHRNQLRSWEKAEALCDLEALALAADEPRTVADIAADVGVGAAWARVLMRLKKRLRPDIWELFKTTRGIKAADLLELAKLGHNEQLDKWNELVEKKHRVGRGRGRGPEKRPGEKKLAKYLLVCPTIDEKPEVRRAYAYAFKVALGLERWRYGTVPLDQRKHAMPEAFKRWQRRRGRRYKTAS